MFNKIKSPCRKITFVSKSFRMMKDNAPHVIMTDLFSFVAKEISICD